MAYAENTSVAFDRSIGEIIALVKKSGAARIAQDESEDQYTLCFLLAERLIRFKLPMPNWDDIPKYDGRRQVMSTAARNAKWEQAKRQRGRALLLVIKAKLESVESGIETIEQAFLAHVVMADGQTVFERISAPLALEYQTGVTAPNAGLLTAPGGA